jgi:hypothetical protein
MLRQILRRPIIPFAVIVIAFLALYPRVGAREVVFHETVPHCADELVVSAFQEDELMRSHKRALGGTTEVTHSFELPAGEYLLRVEVSCGDKRGALERTLMLDKSGDVAFDLSDECECS